MNNFTVSARKYRPGTFDTVIGQDHVTRTLKNAIKKGHIGHAFLFCGPRGVGKTTCARILAKALNCQNLTPEGEPCGTCDACKSFATQQTFNIYELDAASNNSVDDIRNLTDQVRFAPQSGKYKIYIIDEVHMLTSAAFNAFLKTLEEPPSYAIFILATTEKHKVIPTILSRCQVYDFHRISISGIIDQLNEICKSENISAEEEALYVIAQKADGALRDALSIFDRVVSFSGEKVTYGDVIENLNVLDYDYYFRVVDLVLSKDLSSLLLLFDNILKKGFDSHNFLNGLSEHFRNLLVASDKDTINLLEVSEGTQHRYIGQASKTSISFLLSSLSILNQFDVGFKASKNQRLHVEIALMKLSHLPDILQMPAVSIQELPITTGIEKKKLQPDLIVEIESKVNSVEESHSLVEKQVKESETYIDSLTSGSKKDRLEPNVDFNSEIAKAANDISTRTKQSRLERIRNEVISNNHKQVVENLEVQEEVFAKPDEVKFFNGWDAYCDTLIERKKQSLHSLSKNIRPVLHDDGRVVITIENESIKNQFLDDRNFFVDLLYEKFQISGFSLVYHVVPPAEENLHKYTTADKLKKLIDLNPAIADMQKCLGLRVEY